MLLANLTIELLVTFFQFSYSIVHNLSQIGLTRQRKLKKISKRRQHLLLPAPVYEPVRNKYEKKKVIWRFLEKRWANLAKVLLTNAVGEIQRLNWRLSLELVPNLLHVLLTNAMECSI